MAGSKHTTVQGEGRIRLGFFRITSERCLEIYRCLLIFWKCLLLWLICFMADADPECIVQ